MHAAGPDLEFESEAPPFSGPSPELYGQVELRHDGRWVVKGLEGDSYTTEEEAQDKARGEPCKQGEAASRTGCIPRQHGPPRKPGEHNPDSVAAKIQALFDKGGLSFEDATEIKDALMSMRKVDIVEVRRKLGLSATGNKQEMADKISQLAMWKMGEGPSPFGGKYGRGRDGAGRGGAGQEPGAGGEGVAPETGGPGDEAAGGAGADDSESSGQKAAADLSRAKKRVLDRVGRYKDVMLKKGMKDQAGWMEELAKHVEELGAEGALAALGEEKAARKPGEQIQYVGAYDDLVGGVDKDSKFVKKYLENAGIVLAGSTIDPNLSVISSWSKRNIAAQGREVPETPGGYVPSDQTFTNKLEESQALPGLESSEDIHKVFGDKVTHFTPDVVAKLDQKYGKGSWIVKSYGEEAYAGFGIFFPQRVKQIHSDSKALMADAKSWLHESGYLVAKDESGKVVGVKKGGKTYAVGTPEYGKLPKKMQRYGKQAIQASHAINGAALPSSPLDSLQNDYGISFIRDKDGLPTGITNYDGKDYNFDDPKIKEIEDLDGGATGYAIHRAQEADEWRRQGYKNEPKFMVQPAFKAVGVSDYDRAMGNTWETAKEGRVHCVTRNGKASAVPYATLVGRGDDLPAVFQSEDSRAMEKAVEEAINQLPESERAGQMYAPDVMKTKDGWKVIELNPSAEGGGSDWLGRNPFVIDAVVSHLTDREPQHVKFVRDLMRKEGVKLPTTGGRTGGKPGRGDSGKTLKGWFRVQSNGTLRYIRKGSARGKPCKQGQSASRTGCIPSSGQGSRSTDQGGRKPSGSESGGRYASSGELGSVYTVKLGSMTSKYSLHSNKRIDGPSIPLKNYKQQDDHSCGFVAALTVCRLLAPEVSAKDVLRAVRPTKSGGIDGESLIESLGQLGVDAKFRDDLTIGNLRKAVEKGIPVMLTVYPEDWTSDHWTVVQGFDDSRIYLTNYKSLSIAQFKQEWFDVGDGIVCQPGKDRT